MVTNRSIRLPIACRLLSPACAVIIALSLIADSAVAQQPDPLAPVKLTYNGDVELRVLVDFVSKTLGIQILIDEGLAQQKVSLNAPGDVPRESLLPLLQSALRMKGFALVNADVPGWKRIVSAANMLEFAGPEILTKGDVSSSEGPVTRIFILENADPKQMETTIAPFLSKSGPNTIANTVVVEGSKALIVSDFVSNLLRIEKLIQLIDQPKAAADIRFVQIKNISCVELSKQLKSLAEARNRAVGKTDKDPTGLEIVAEERTNQLILIGSGSLVKEFTALAESFDKPLDTVIRNYTLRHATTEQIAKYAERMRDALPIPPPYTSSIESNTLIISTTEELHAQIRLLIERLDTPQSAPESSPIRFYRMKNVPVEDIVRTLQNIGRGSQSAYGGQAGFGGPNGPNQAASSSSSIFGPGGLTDPRSQMNGVVPGPNQPFANGFAGSQGSFLPPEPPAYRPADRTAEQAQQQPGFLEELGRLVQPAGYSQPRVLPGPAQVSADPNTNTLIIVAEPEVQKVYQTLIEALDRRPPQVMIEARIVVIDTSDDYSLGVEVSGGDRSDPKKLFAFTSYGLSTVDPKNGSLSVLPSLGLNGVLVDPDTADLVVKALAAHKRARVLSAPRLLVNDNAEGQLTSVSEVPFTSVNASQTVATTSFAGFAEAGTTINVKPTISQDDYLQLDYVITLNTFTGAGSTGVPPPRQTNEVQSRVSVPDGYTIIVGGLNQMNRSNNVSGLPYIENIPIVRNFLSQKSSQDRQSSLFVFLRPVILRDDKFRDLRFLSNRDTTNSGEPADFPQSTPLEIE
jgi:general secretion pathway protein D